MKLVRQPKGSKQCGQACVAMVAGVSLKQSIELFKHTSSTRTRDIIKALRCAGIRCTSSRLVPFRHDTLFLTAIVKVQPLFNRKNNWHWVVWHNGKVYDPSGYVAAGIPVSYLCISWKRSSVTMPN
jgi:hypothetical protein